MAYIQPSASRSPSTDIDAPALHSPGTPAGDRAATGGSWPLPANSLHEGIACATLAQLIEDGDPEALLDIRHSEAFQDAITLALESREADFAERLHPGTRQALLHWLEQDDVAARLEPDVAGVLNKLYVLLTVQDGDGEIRGKTPEERRAEAVLTRWAAAPSAESAGFCKLLIWHLMRLHHEGGQDLRGRLPNQARQWDRLEQAGLLRCLGALTDISGAESTRHSVSLNQRLTSVLDKVMMDDALAAQCAANAVAPAAGKGRTGDAGGAGDVADVPGPPALKTFEAVESLVGFLDKVPATRWEPNEGWQPFGQAVSAISEPPPEGSGLPPASLWSSAWKALTTMSGLEAASPPVPFFRMPSTLGRHPSRLSRLDSETSTRGGPLPRQESSSSSHPSSVLPRYSPSEASSVRSQAWSGNGWSSREGSAKSFTPPPHSLDWLPSLGATVPFTPEPVIEELPFEAGRTLQHKEVVAVMQVLEAAESLPLTPVLKQWQRAALTALQDGLMMEEGPARIKVAEMKLLQATLFLLMRVAFDRVSGIPGSGNPGSGDPGSGGGGLRFRGAAEMAALRELSAWAEAGSGVEGARRDRWIDAIMDRALQPDGRPLLPAALLRKGDELPPWSCVRSLVGGDRVGDKATLVWRGEELEEVQTVSRLLEGLGIRHVDLLMSAIEKGGSMASLALDCVSAATIHVPSTFSRETLDQALFDLAMTMGSLYVVRLKNLYGAANIDADHLPPRWDHVPDKPGELVHMRREDIWRLMDPLRDLWPQRRLPPALRTSALNPYHGGREVLEYLGDLRSLRAGHREFRNADLEMCVRLDSVIEGMYQDEGYAARCKTLVQNPDGACSDAGMRMLAAMAAMWEVAEARTPAEVADSAFTQACLIRADASRAERRPDFVETLEDAMVLRWFVSSALRDLLGSDRIRLSPKPMFGRIGEGDDCDTPERREAFQQEALELVRDEARDGFPGLVVLIDSEGPLGESFRDQLMEGALFEALNAREAEAKLAYGQALDHDSENDSNDANDAESRALAQASATLATIEAERREARHAVLAPYLEKLKLRVLGEPTSRPGTGMELEMQTPAPADEPPAKRARLASSEAAGPSWA